MFFQSLWSQTINIFQLLFQKLWIILAFILSIFLTLIGYPKAVLSFIILLIVLDILTKWYSITKIKYGKFKLRYFFQAWKAKELNSARLEIGLFSKLIIYSILLIIAHQISILGEMLYGTLISNVFYSGIIIVDVSSILEKLTDAGITPLKPFADFIKGIKSKIFKESELPSLTNGTQNNPIFETDDDDSVG